MLTLAETVLAGDRLALARLLSHLENETPEGRAALAALFPHTGRAHLIGVTGAPGTGKSTLVNQLARFYRHPAGEAVPRRVAVIAVDPSSPFTGGAILGDRIRMRDLAGDPGVFIRSMASRGSLGGLAAATAGVAQAFDAAGYEIILIETVGAGQAEVDIAGLAHTTLVIEAPGLGDDIQAIKAGLLEIADILVVNKADRPGVENTERALRSMLDLSHPARRESTLSEIPHHNTPVTPNQEPSPLLWARTPRHGSPAPEHPASPIWIPPIQRTVSTEGVGIPELAGLIALHRQHLQGTGDWQRRERHRLQTELEKRVQESLLSRWRTGLQDGAYEETLEAVIGRKLSPHEAAERLINDFRE